MILKDLKIPENSNALMDVEFKPSYSTRHSDDRERFYVSSVQDKPGKNFQPDLWLVNLLYFNYEKIRELNPKKMVFTFVYFWENQCNFEFKAEIIEKIAAMKAILCIITEEDE